MQKKILAAILSIALVILVAPCLAKAQDLSAMAMPIPTTITVAKPAPGQTYAGTTTVTMGVGGKIYKFILKDGTTNSFKVRWPDIWEYVQQHNPNFVVQGDDAGTFAKIQPGQTMKISGAFAPLDRTFEVLTVEQAGGDTQHY